MSGELPRVQSQTLFASYKEKKHIETEAQKIMVRINSLRAEHQKLQKKIQLTEKEAENIYQHRVDLQLKVNLLVKKKEEKMRSKISVPVPFTLEVNRQQREMMQKIKDKQLQQRKTEAQILRESLRKDERYLKEQKDQEIIQYRYRVGEVKQQEQLSNIKAGMKLKEKRDRVRENVSYERLKIEQEKQLFEQSVQELERQEQEALYKLQQTVLKQKSIEEKKNKAHQLSLQEYDKIFHSNVFHETK